MDDLEHLVRDGLRARAERVDTTVPLVARSRRAARRRRGTRAVVAAAAAVVVVVGGTAILGGDPRDTSPAPAPTTDGAGTPEPMAPQGWRTEQWHDLAVDVPAHWGYGAAPMRLVGDTNICGDLPDGPYVGRPVMVTDMCWAGDQLPGSSAPYVWLGADVEPGTVALDDGTIQKTVEVAGTTLTVAADAPLRRRILASARTGDTCPAELRRAPTSALPLPDTGVGLLVCGYRTDGERQRLVGSQLLGVEASRRLVNAYAATDTMSSMPACAEEGGRELVVVQVRDRQWVVDLECSGIRELGAAPFPRHLTIAIIEPLATEVLRNVLYGPTSGRLAGSFNGSRP